MGRGLLEYEQLAMKRTFNALEQMGTIEQQAQEHINQLRTPEYYAQLSAQLTQAFSDALSTQPEIARHLLANFNDFLLSDFASLSIEAGSLKMNLDLNAMANTLLTLSAAGDLDFDSAENKQLYNLSNVAELLGVTVEVAEPFNLLSVSYKGFLIIDEALLLPELEQITQAYLDEQEKLPPVRFKFL